MVVRRSGTTIENTTRSVSTNITYIITKNNYIHIMHVFYISIHAQTYCCYSTRVYATRGGYSATMSIDITAEYQVITISILSSIVRFDDSGMVPGRSVEFVIIYRHLDNTRTCVSHPVKKQSPSLHRRHIQHRTIPIRT